MTSAMDRREFVLRCSGAGAALMLGGCVAMVTHPVPVVDGRVALSLADYPDLATPTGAIKIQPARSADPLFVLAQPGGKFIAVSPICTHRGCTVDVQGERLVCPCHGSTYDRSGVVLRGPAQRPLRSYAVSRRGDILTIDLAEARS
jgi:cytochrome b6-f complex iron-sulfur subunit